MEKIWIRTGLINFKSALKEKGVAVDYYASKILEGIEKEKEKEIKLIAFPIPELGFPGGGFLGDAYNKAFNLGFDFCPPEIGPAVCIMGSRQEVRIAMRPVYLQGRPFILGAGNFRLKGVNGSVCSFLGRNTYLIFKA